MQYFMVNTRLFYWWGALLVPLIVIGNGYLLSTIKNHQTHHSAESHRVTDSSGTQGFAQQASQQTKSDDADRIERLSKYLTGTRWTGQFTIVGNDAKPPAPEEYEIMEAIKSEEGDNWNLVVRIKYGKKDVTLPLPPLEIKWAGETPVITVDRLTIPTMGTFDARVLIRRGQYAGTWAHDDVGGHLFGTIDKIENGGEQVGEKQGGGEQDDADKASTDNIDSTLQELNQQPIS